MGDTELGPRRTEPAARSDTGGDLFARELFRERPSSGAQEISTALASFATRAIPLSARAGDPLLFDKVAAFVTQTPSALSQQAAPPLQADQIVAAAQAIKVGSVLCRALEVLPMVTIDNSGECTINVPVTHSMEDIGQALALYRRYGPLSRGSRSFYLDELDLKANSLIDGDDWAMSRLNKSLAAVRGQTVRFRIVSLGPDFVYYRHSQMTEAGAPISAVCLALACIAAAPTLTPAQIPQRTQLLKLTSGSVLYGNDGAYALLPRMAAYRTPPWIGYSGPYDGRYSNATFAQCV